MTYVLLQKSRTISEQVFVPKILCLGSNYAEHIKEMQGMISNQEPVVFLKPSSALLQNGKTVLLPGISKSVHHETEVVLLIGKTGKNIPKQEAGEYIMGYGIGLDLTLRDIQKEAKEKGKPWAIAKGFDTSAPVSGFVRPDLIIDPNNIDFRLYVNDELRQTGNTSDMIYKFDDIISYLSSYFTLNRGDLIFTGTPQGVGEIKENDVLRAELGDVLKLQVQVKNE